MSVADKQRSLFDTFGAIPDSQEKLAAILDWSKRLPRLPVEDRLPSNRVPGCVSPVWVIVEKLPDATFKIKGDAESPVVRALVTVICEIYNGAAAEEILTAEPTLLDDLGLWQGLSVTRRNGLLGVRARIQEGVGPARARPAARL